MTPQGHTIWRPWWPSYDQIFGFHLLAGKPFFFFKKEGKIGVSYGGQVLPQQYDLIPHYGCCDSDIYNPWENDTVTGFYADRDEQWHYVEMGIYN